MNGEDEDQGGVTFVKKENTIEELVLKEEHRIEKRDQGTQAAKKESLKVPMILLGALVYSVGMNCFLRPLKLYSGGLMGFAQLIQDLLARAGFQFGGFNITGILYYLMNVPGILLAVKKMRRRFIVKTIIAITAIMVLLSVIPIPSAPVLDDTMANTMIAGLICGAGIGMILWMGACDGGMNIIGMLVIASRGKGSVGQIGLYANIVLYTIMLFLFDIPTVIYSLIYSVFNSIAADRIHTQNISSQVMVITKLEDTKDMEVEVMGRLHRGMTEINGSGIFTGDSVKIFMIFVSKYEVNRLKGIIRSHDPQAFIVETQGVRIDGHFLKKLT